MKTWLRRLLGLTLISLGISMTFLPFNNTQSGSYEQDIVTLQTLDFINLDELEDQYTGMEIQELKGPEFNPDDYPQLWDCFINLSSYGAPTETCNLDEWTELQSSVLEDILDLRLIVYREMLISCSVEKSNEGEDITEIAFFKALGKYNPHIKTLTESDLEKYPLIFEAIRNIETKSELIAIPIREWYRMVDKFLEPMDDLQTFRFKDNYYGPEFGYDYIEIKGSISNFSNILKIIGIVLLLLGITIMVKLYFNISKKGTILLLDFIALLFGIGSAYMALNLLLSKILFILPIIDDEFLLFMGVFFLFTGIPALARYISNLTLAQK